MFLGGFNSAYLEVNLDTGSCSVKEIEHDILKKHLGGYGLNAYLAQTYVRPGEGFFDADSPIILGAGPFVGSFVPSAGKSVVTMKSPLSRGVISGYCGGAVGAMMKWAGYDAVVIIGKCAKPSVLTIFDNNVSVVDAQFLWGKDLYETTDKCWDMFGRDSSVLAIGPAGENLVYVSLGLVDKCSSWGKGGLGALMGSKNLKAVVVRGTKGFKAADPKEFRKLASEQYRKITGSPIQKNVVQLGTMDGFDSWTHITGFPSKNHTSVYPVSLAYKYWSPDVYVNNNRKYRLSCIGCAIACKDMLTTSDGKMTTYVSSFYGRIMNWGSRCNVGELDNVISCQDYSNKMGLCTHSVTSLIDWLAELVKCGIVTEDEIGFKLESNFQSVMKLLEMVVNRQGIGDILADGYKGAIKKIGRGCERYAVQIKGMETLYDPRLTRLNTPDFSQITSHRAEAPQGASTSYNQLSRPIEEYKNWCKKIEISREAQDRIFENPWEFNVGRLTKYAQDYWVLCNSLGINCLRGRVDGFYNISTIRQLLRALTGEEFSSEELLEIGERNFNLMKLLNVREGFSRNDDSPPDRWFEPIITEDGEVKPLRSYYGKVLTRKDVKMLLDDYYDERGWREEGIPTAETLTRLGLQTI